MGVMCKFEYIHVSGPLRYNTNENIFFVVNQDPYSFGQKCTLTYINLYYFTVTIILWTYQTRRFSFKNFFYGQVFNYLSSLAKKFSCLYMVVWV